MAERNPPLYMDVSSAYSGDELGVPWRHIVSEGIADAAALEVVQATPAGLSVTVKKGWAAVLGDTNLDLQPLYWVFNDADVNKGVAPDPSLPRKAIVVAQIVDEAFAGTGRLWRIDVILGTPAASPAVPATPPSALLLAELHVAAGATQILTANITDKRALAGMKLGAGGAPSGGTTILRKTTQKLVVNTNALTDLLNGEITIPAGALGTDKKLTARLLLSWLQNTGGSLLPPRLQISLGGTVVLDVAGTGINVAAHAARRAFLADFECMNLGAANSQAWKGRYSAQYGPSNAVAGWIDTAQGSDYYDKPWAAVSAIDTTLARLLEVKVAPTTAHSLHDVRLDAAFIEIA